MGANKGGEYYRNTLSFSRVRNNKLVNYIRIKLSLSTGYIVRREVWQMKFCSIDTDKTYLLCQCILRLSRRIETCRFPEENDRTPAYSGIFGELRFRRIDSRPLAAQCIYKCLDKSVCSRCNVEIFNKRT